MTAGTDNGTNLYRPICVEKSAGHPNIAGLTLEVALKGGLTLRVDESDAHWVEGRNVYVRYSGRIAYAIIRREGKSQGLHRVIMGAKPGQTVDHIDGNGLNNSRGNLRFCTKSQNAQNLHNLKPGKASKFKGVSAREGYWIAQIKADGRNRVIGSFRTQIEAAQAYDKAARELHGAFATTNASLGLLDGPAPENFAPRRKTKGKRMRVSQATREAYLRSHRDRLSAALNW